MQLVQVAERLCQTCLRARFMGETRMDPARQRQAWEGLAKERDCEQAAVCI